LQFPFITYVFELDGKHMQESNPQIVTAKCGTAHMTY